MTDKSLLPRLNWARGWHVMHEGRGDSWTIYFGRHRGARYLSIDVRGFNGWTSSPWWMPGGWEFYNPTLHWGRAFRDGTSGYRGTRVLVPAKLVHAKRMLNADYRRAMREEPIRDDG